MLGLLDDGRSTDSKGITVNAKNCVIIFTSNIGSELFGSFAPAGIGFGAEKRQLNTFETTKQRVIEMAKSSLRPELWNRIDEVLIYRPHEIETVRKIAVDLLAKENIKCQEKGINLSWSTSLVEYLAAKGYDPNYGARPMKRVIMKELQTLLATALLKREVQRGDNVILEVVNGVVTWRKI